MISMVTLPCLIGLRTLRPRRLFGFNGLTDGAPLSPTACNDLGVCGLPSVTATSTIADLRRFDLQGGTGPSTISHVERGPSPRPSPRKNGERGKKSLMRRPTGRLHALGQHHR